MAQEIRATTGFQAGELPVCDLTVVKPNACDSQLLRRYSRLRDEQAFQELVERHGPMVMKVIQNFLWQHVDVEDAFQKVFAILARKSNTLAQHPSLAGWLHSTAVNVARRHRRDISRTRKVELVDDPVSKAREPWNMISRSNEMEVLHQEIDRLKPNYRDVMVLFYFEGKTRQEIAALVGRPTGAVKANLERARQQLKSRLLRHGIVGTAAFTALGSCQALAANCANELLPSPQKQDFSNPQSILARCSPSVGAGSLINMTTFAFISTIFLFFIVPLGIANQVALRPNHESVVISSLGDQRVSIGHENRVATIQQAEQKNVRQSNTAKLVHENEKVGSNKQETRVERIWLVHNSTELTPEQIEEYKIIKPKLNVLVDDLGWRNRVIWEQKGKYTTGETGTRLVSETGRLYREHLDTDNDGETDVWTYYRKDQIRHRDRMIDGHVLAESYFEKFKLQARGLPNQSADELKMRIIMANEKPSPKSKALRPGDQVFVEEMLGQKIGEELGIVSELGVLQIDMGSSLEIAVSYMSLSDLELALSEVFTAVTKHFDLSKPFNFRLSMIRK